MLADLTVEFPKPCSEPWDQMSPRGCNRHCASCDKIVHDLATLTYAEAEALLELGTEVCVRAQVGTDGTVKLKPDEHRPGRRIVAAIGAGLALATAACQTVPPSDRPNRFEISGKFASIDWTRTAELRSADGRKWGKRREPGTGRFIFENLYPGVYELTVKDMCGNRVPVDTITIADASVDLGRPVPELHCIIVGAMVKVERPERA